jgi:hypothetical protein
MAFVFMVSLDTGSHMDPRGSGYLVDGHGYEIF